MVRFISSVLPKEPIIIFLSAYDLKENNINADVKNILNIRFTIIKNE